MKEIQQHLAKQKELLALEKRADYEQYMQKLSASSFVERRKEGICWYPVLVEKTTYDAGERLIVKVSRPKEHSDVHLFGAGKPVLFFCNIDGKLDDALSVKGVVNRVGQQEMHISLQCDEPPQWMMHGKQGVQLLFDENSYKEAEYALMHLQQTNDETLLNLLQVLILQKAPQFDDSKTARLPHLNKWQEAAVNKILGAKEVAMVHGPPGTGKTTTLVAAIQRVLETEKQVMVSAPSNAAVDLLVDKLTKKGVSVVRIGNPARVTQEQLDHTLDAKFARHTDYKLLKTIKKQADEYLTLAKKYKRNFGTAEREQRKLLYAEVSKLRKEIDQLEYYINNEIITKTQVIATTLVGASNYTLRGKTFTSVFIDEAAQGLEPYCWIPILKANRVILAGDHKQLPPTVKSTEAAREGLTKTLFERAMENTTAALLLNEQYRMHRLIMQFSSQMFYDSKLEAHATVAEHCLFADDRAVEFIDTAGCGYGEQMDKETKSYRNKEEGQLLIRYWKQYMEMLTMHNVPLEGINVGIISPYKAQTELLQELYKEEIGIDGNIAVSINTVDSFQGQEREVILISLVRSNERNEIGFLADIRRMNVAMTRAKKKLVIVGDSGTIANNKFYASLLDYVGEINAYRSAYEII